MSEFAGQISELQSDFQRIADRNSWVRAAFTLHAGRFGMFMLGRATSDGASETLVASLSQQEIPIVTELYGLTDQAGYLIGAMIKDKCYTWRPAYPPGVNFDLRDRWNSWLLYLLLTPPVAFNCWAKQPDGTAFIALPQSGESEVGIWIDNYPQVCVSALSVLKTGLHASPRANTTLSQPPVPQMTNDPTAGPTQPALTPTPEGITKIARAIAMKRAHPEMMDKHVANAVGCDPSTLSGSPDYRAARDALAAEQAKRLNRSRRSRGSDLDAYSGDSGE